MTKYVENDVVAPIHPKAMPVVLTTPAEIETWMTTPAEEALKLQRPLHDGVLAIVARAGRKMKHRLKRKSEGVVRSTRRSKGNEGGRRHVDFQAVSIIEDDRRFSRLHAMRNDALDAVGIHKLVVAVDNDLNELCHVMLPPAGSTTTPGRNVQGSGLRTGTPFGSAAGVVILFGDLGIIVSDPTQFAAIGVDIRPIDCRVRLSQFRDLLHE
jgi:hypothetical protein